MMTFVRIVAGLHLVVYLGIMWYGWQSYKLLRKKSWRYMGVGFGILLIYRTWRFVEHLFVEQVRDAERTLLPFIGAVFLLVAFRMLCSEHRHLLSIMAEPVSIRSGAQPVEYWLSKTRAIIREELAALRSTPAAVTHLEQGGDSKHDVRLPEESDANAQRD